MAEYPVTDITSWSDTEIVCKVPVGAPVGAGTMKVTNDDAEYDDIAFTVLETPTPVVVSEIDPDTGMVGATVTITGTGFLATKGSGGVKFVK